MRRKYLDDLEARGRELGRQKVKRETIVRAWDAGIRDIWLISKIADVSEDFVKDLLKEKNRLEDE